MLLPYLFRTVKTAIKGGRIERERELPWYEAVVVMSIVGLISYLMTR
jgi:hypothetical protein